jgi:hypothetical protein
MDRRNFLLTLPPLLAGCVAVGGVAGPAAEAPRYRVGDRWVYNAADGYRVPVTWTETHEVVAVGASDIEVRVTLEGPTMNYMRTERLRSPGVLLVGAVYDDAETRRFASPVERYRFPLTPGASWTQTIDNYNETLQQNDQMNRFVKVGGYEKVTTSAGTFDALLMRIIMYVNVNEPFRTATECNYELWWAPAVGAMVRETKFAQYREKGDGREAAAIRAQNTRLELASFQRGA